MKHPPFPDCRVFTLEEFPYTYVNEADTTWNRVTTTYGDCFIWCFDTQGCYTFFFDGNLNMCKLYTHCGTNCALLYTGYSNQRVFIRRCHDRK